MNNPWQNKRVLVTGAGGFIGSHLVEALLNQGAKVRAFIRYTSRGDLGLLRFLPKDRLTEVDIMAGDLRDAHAIQQCVNDIEVVLVNDGSKDESQKILEEQKKYFSFLNVVNIYPNQGYGNAVFAGLKEAKGDLIGWTHGDMQTPPEDIIKAFSFA